MQASSALRAHSALPGPTAACPLESLSSAPRLARLLSHSGSGGAVQLKSPVGARHFLRARITARAASTPPPPAPSGPLQASSVLAPGPNVSNIANAGAAKAALPEWKTLLGGILAGVYIAYGGFLSLSIGGALPGIAAANPGLQKLIMALLFPMNIVMVTICGAELYTGNTATVMTALYEGKATKSQAFKSFFYSYIGNWIGSWLMAVAVAATGMMSTNPLPLAMAVAKTSLDFPTAVLRAILCNWLVVLAVWMAASASSLPGKVAALWPPVCAFFAIGLEHSVANMFFITLGIKLGAKVTFAQLWINNLLPVTIGNTIAGALCMALPYALLYGGLGQRLQAALQGNK